MTNLTIAALKATRKLIREASDHTLYSGQSSLETAMENLDTLITQLEQAGEVDKRALNTDALNKAIEVGAEQFGQQMRLGGGSLSEMFTRVIRAYLDAAAPAPKHGN